MGSDYAKKHRVSKFDPTKCILNPWNCSSASVKFVGFHTQQLHLL